MMKKMKKRTKQKKSNINNNKKTIVYHILSVCVCVFFKLFYFNM